LGSEKFELSGNIFGKKMVDFFDSFEYANINEYDADTGIKNLNVQTVKIRNGIYQN
jgi:hypothetical protein